MVYKTPPSHTAVEVQECGHLVSKQLFQMANRLTDRPTIHPSVQIQIKPIVGRPNQQILVTKHHGLIRALHDDDDDDDDEATRCMLHAVNSLTREG